MDNPTPIVVFDRYEVIRRIATGGMGDIFLARQRGVAGFSRLVILKTLLPELADDAAMVEQFLDEARVASALNHPNIVGIYEAGVWQGVHFIAMEHVRGESLSKLLQEAQRHRLSVPWAVAVQVVRDVALGLDHAHHATSQDGVPLNIVHRDVTPQNIMLRVDGVVKVVDFGIAKASGNLHKTQRGQVKGKLQFMAPEVMRGEVFDHRADQFALGAVLYELTVGRRLFDAKSPAAIFRQVLSGDVARPGDVVDGYPLHLERVVLRMLHDDASQRFGRLLDVAAALSAWLDHNNIPADFVRLYSERVLAERVNQSLLDLTPQPTVIHGLHAEDGAQCPSCGAVALVASAQFCSRCGAALHLPERMAAFADGVETAPLAKADIQRALHAPTTATPATAWAVPPPSEPVATGSRDPFFVPPTTGVTSSPSVRDIFGDGVVPHSAEGAMSDADERRAPSHVRTHLLEGRAEERERVAARLADPSAGRGTMFVGDEGAGKTALLHHTASAAQGMGYLSLFAVSRSPHMPTHLDVVRQMLGQAARRFRLRGSAPLSGLLQRLPLEPCSRRRVLHMLFGETLPSHYSQDPQANVQAVADVFRAMAQARPLCLVVDGWTATDALSQEVLQALVRDEEDTHVVVFSSTTTAAHVRGFVAVEMQPLADGTLQRWLRRRVKGSLPFAAVRALCAASSGNPGLCEAHLQALVSAEELTQVHGAWRSTPELALDNKATLTTLMEARARALSAPAQAFLAAAHVEGFAFVPTFVAEVLQGRASSYNAALQEIVDAGFVARHAWDEERYTFTSQASFAAVHDVLVMQRREALLALQQHLHRVEAPTLSQTLLTFYVDDELGDVDVDTVAPVVDELMRHGNRQQAMRLSLQALDLMQRRLRQRGPEATLSPSHLRLVMQTAERFGALASAEVLQRLLRVAPLLSPSSTQAERAGLQHVIGARFLAEGDLEAAQAWLERALHNLSETSSTRTPSVLADLALVMQRRGAFSDAHAQLLVALETATESGAEPGFLWQRYLQLADLLQRHQREEALHALVAALAHANASDDGRGERIVTVALARLFVAQGQLALARDHLQKAQRIAEHQGEAHRARLLAAQQQKLGASQQATADS